MMRFPVTSSFIELTAPMTVAQLFFFDVHEFSRRQGVSCFIVFRVCRNETTVFRPFINTAITEVIHEFPLSFDPIVPWHWTWINESQQREYAMLAFHMLDEPQEYLNFICTTDVMKLEYEHCRYLVSIWSAIHSQWAHLLSLHTFPLNDCLLAKFVIAYVALCGHNSMPISIFKAFFESNRV